MSRLSNVLSFYGGVVFAFGILKIYADWIDTYDLVLALMVITGAFAFFFIASFLDRFMRSPKREDGYGV